MWLSEEMKTPVPAVAPMTGSRSIESVANDLRVQYAASGAMSAVTLREFLGDPSRPTIISAAVSKPGRLGTSDGNE